MSDLKLADHFAGMKLCDTIVDTRVKNKHF